MPVEFHNNSQDGEINRKFFPNLMANDCDGTSDMYFEIQDIKFFEDIVSQDEMDTLHSRELQNLADLRLTFEEEVQEGKIMQSLI